MALTTRFLPHSVKLIGAAIWINQVESISPDMGVSLFSESTGSETDREFVAIKGIAPVLPIVTSDLSLLTTIGFAGLSFVYASGAIAYGRVLKNGALPDSIANSTHLSLTFNDGLIVPMSIIASHNSVAKLALMLHAYLGVGGNTEPMIVAATTTIAAGAGATANIYTGGPIKYTISGGASRLVYGIKHQQVSFGIAVVKDSDSSEVHLTQCAIIGRDPKIEFTTDDVALIAEIGDGISVSAFASYFRNVAANGQRVAPATATHVSISGTAGMVTPGAVNLAHKQAGHAAFTYTPVKNTNTITLSATAAIPTS